MQLMCCSIRNFFEEAKNEWSSNGEQGNRKGKCQYVIWHSLSLAWSPEKKTRKTTDDRRLN